MTRLLLLTAGSLAALAALLWRRHQFVAFDDIDDAIDWLTHGKGLPPDPDDDMARVQVDVRPWMATLHAGELVLPISTQTGPLGPAA